MNYLPTPNPLSTSFDSAFEIPKPSANELLEIEEQIALYSKRVRENYHLVDEYIELARLFRRKQDYRRGFWLLKNLLLRDDLRREQESRALIELAYIQLFSKSKDLGEFYFLQALKLNRDSLYLLDGLYHSYRIQGKFDQAAEILRGLIKKDPERKTDLVNLLCEAALQKASSSDLSGAKSFVSSAQALKTDTPYLFLALSKVQALDEKKKDAIQTLEEFIGRWPDFTLFATKRIETLYFELDQYNRYPYTLTRCLQRNPQNFYVHHALGKYLIKIRKTDEALEHFEKAIDLCPYSVHSLKEIIKLYVSKNDVDGVLKMIETFLASPLNQQALACPRCHGINSNENCPLCASSIAGRTELQDYRIYEAK